MSAVSEIMSLRQELLGRSEALRDIRAASGTPETLSPRNESTPGIAFADTLNTALREVSAVQERSSTMQEGYERGTVTDIAQVMLARQEAGLAFEATLQVRNKLLNAYQEIMRMGA